MRALLNDEGIRLRDDYPMPEPNQGEALVRVRLAGICNTDLEIAKGYMGFRGVPGHEFVGEVVAAPEGSGLRSGQRVVGEINAGCGTCEWCLGSHPSAFRDGVDPHVLISVPGAPASAGDSRHCPNRTVLGILRRDGAFAEYLTLPVRNLIPVPDALSDESAVFVEPIAAACEILDQVAIGPGVSVVVLGDGKLGTLVAQVLHGTGADVLATGRHEDKLARLGALGIPTALTDRLPTRQWDVVVEATGSAQGMEQAIGLVRPRGTIVLKTTVASPITVNLAPVVVNEIRVIGSRCGRFTPAIERLEAGTIDVAPLISARFPLARGVEAIDYASQRGVLKVLLEP